MAKKKKGKKGKVLGRKLTQEQEDILGLARQVMRLEEGQRGMGRDHQTLGELGQKVRLLEERLAAVGEVLRSG